MYEPQTISMVFRERGAGEGGQEAIQIIPTSGINVRFFGCFDLATTNMTQRAMTYGCAGPLGYWSFKRMQPKTSRSLQRLERRRSPEDQFKEPCGFCWHFGYRQIDSMVGDALERR